MIGGFGVFLLAILLIVQVELLDSYRRMDPCPLPRRSMCSSRRLVAGILASFLVLLAFAGTPGSGGLPQPPEARAATSTPPAAPEPSQALTAPQVDLSWVPTSREWVAWDCASFFATAMDAGWTWVDWPKLAGDIMPGESGCDPGQTNLRGRDRSYGLLMINTRGRLWWAPIGYGETRSLRELCNLQAPADLLVPEVNLRCGRQLHELYAAWGRSHPRSGITGWKPWE